MWVPNRAGNIGPWIPNRTPLVAIIIPNMAPCAHNTGLWQLVGLESLNFKNGAKMGVLEVLTSRETSFKVKTPKTKTQFWNFFSVHPWNHVQWKWNWFLFMPEITVAIPENPLCKLSVKMQKVLQLRLSRIPMGRPNSHFESLNFKTF